MKSASKIGFRREISILLPTTLLVLIILAIFTLLSYRRGVDTFLGESHAGAISDARLAAARLARARSLDADFSRVRALFPRALAITLINADGTTALSSGDLPPGKILGPLEGLAPAAPLAFGPDDDSGARVIAFAPLGPPEARQYLRLDLPAIGLARELANVRRLTALMGVLIVGVILLSALSVRHLLAPLDKLVERARAAVPTTDENADELPFLLETFDRALAALSNSDENEDDIHVLGRTLTPNLDCGVLILSPEGNIFSLNALGCDLLGLDAPTPGRSYQEVFAARPELTSLLSKALTGDGVAPRSEILLEGEDQSTSLGLTVHELRRDTGVIRGYLVLFADLTDVQRKAEQRQLARSLAQMGELTAGIAHEMRNSLTSLSGYLSLAQRRDDASAVSSELAEIRHEADHLQRILEDFLSFARPGSIRLSEVSLEKVVRRAASDLAVAGKSVRVHSTGIGSGNRVPRVWGDSQLLERALRNLLNNAAEAEEENAHQNEELEVALDYPSSGPTVAIRDRGTGVQPEMEGRLFVPFASNKEKGVGLGLALAQRILDLHGATLEIQDREGGGACASIHFPPSSLVEGRSEEVKK